MARILPWLMAMLLAGGCATHAVTSGRVVVRDDQAAVEVRFSERDRAVLRDYYRANAASQKLPPGLAKRERLPPGLAKRDILPAGLQGRPLPRDLETRLTALPATHVRLRIGRDIVLIHRTSRILIDAVYGIAPE
jgi:hypothetical protein